VLRASGRRFSAEAQSYPVDFLAFLLHSLERCEQLPGLRSALDASVRGELRCCTRLEATAEAPAAVSQQAVAFTMLGLDLPPAPLFSDALERNILPQVPLLQLLAKFDGHSATPCVRPRPGAKTFTLSHLPRFLLLHVKRFSRNNFFTEKNPTLVTFPLRGLQLRDACPLPAGAASVFDLVANVVHEGKPGEGSYKCQVLHKADGLWRVRASRVRLIDL
jgi:U4/U6.U5 tri-snRNP-associated protein 2